MTCHALAKALADSQPNLPSADIARLCVLILSTCSEPERLSDPAFLDEQWRNASFRLDAAADQHCGVAEELDEMFGEGAIEFSPDQIWVLLRAVKVQSQLLSLYTEQPSLA